VKIPAKKILWAMLVMAVVLMSSRVLAQDQSQGDQTSGAKQDPAAAVPDLADIIPLASELSGRLAALENKITGLLDISAVERKYTGIEENLKEPAEQLQKLKDSKKFRLDELKDFKMAIGQQNELLEKTSTPLINAIRHLGAWRKEWLAEKTRWSEWQASLLKERELDQIKSTFAKANDTIETTLTLILTQLEAMLTVQEKAGIIQVKINALASELGDLMEQRSDLIDTSPPMFSSRYFSQFRSDLWYAMQKGLVEIAWPGKQFFARVGWIVLLQVFLSLIVIIAAYRYRGVLKDSERWQFLAVRPFSAGLFLGMMATLFFYKYENVPSTWQLVYTIITGISFARLSGVVIEASWKRQFVYGLMIVLIITRLMSVISLPLPLFRLYMVLTAAAGLFFCLRWARVSGRHKESGLYPWSLRLGSFFFVIIIIMELGGKDRLAEYLFVSSIRSIATVLVFMLFMYMLRGGVEWVFHSSPLRRTAVLHIDTDALIRGAALFINVVLWGVLLPILLLLWGVYDSLEGAMKGLLALGFNLGSQRISVGLLIASAGVLYGSFLASSILQKLFIDKMLVMRRVERGVRLAIGRLVHYVIIVAGFFWVLTILGFEITKLTIMLSALGVGIGFGLQGVVNNFVSGLIVLFERPVRVGDIIELGGTWSEIKRIGLRSTTVRTFDEADVIIPNADLVSNQVTNWTLTNRQVRLIIPVGVAYGSDVALVIETLTACSNANENVSKTRPPVVLFLNFGESSLDFELRVWVLDVDNRLKTKSELNQEIDRSFREAKIEIAFPQRDLHLRSVDESVTLRPPDTTG
jgi:small-conductance mechanosensitive channel